MPVELPPLPTESGNVLMEHAYATSMANHKFSNLTDSAHVNNKIIVLVNQTQLIIIDAAKCTHYDIVKLMFG